MERTFDELRGKLITPRNAERIKKSYHNLTPKEQQKLDSIIQSAVNKGGEIK